MVLVNNPAEVLCFQDVSSTGVICRPLNNEPLSFTTLRAPGMAWKKNLNGNNKFEQ